MIRHIAQKWNWFTGGIEKEKQLIYKRLIKSREKYFKTQKGGTYEL